MAWIYDWTWREYVPGVVARGIARLALPWEPEWDAWPVPVETARDAERSQMSQPGRRTGRTHAAEVDLGRVLIERLQALRRQVIEMTNDVHPEASHVVLMPPYAYQAILAWFWEHEPASLPPPQVHRLPQVCVMGWQVFPSETVNPVQAWELVPMAPEDYVQAREHGDADAAVARVLDRPLTATEIMQRLREPQPWMEALPAEFREQLRTMQMDTALRGFETAYQSAQMTDFGEPTYDALDAAGELGGMTLDEWSAWLDREEREMP